MDQTHIRLDQTNEWLQGLVDKVDGTNARLDGILEQLKHMNVSLIGALTIRSELADLDRRLRALEAQAQP